MTALNVWLQDLLPRTPGLLRPVASRELRLAAREFFAKTHAWREVLALVDAAAGTADYTSFTVADPTNSEVCAVTDVEFQNLTLVPYPKRPIGVAPSGTPTCWYSTVPNTCSIWPVPEATVTGALRFHVALMPKVDATTVPDFVYQRYYDALIDGALSRIYIHPNKPYTNAKDAAFHLLRFKQAIGQAAAAVKTGHNNAQVWRFPSFA